MSFLNGSGNNCPWNNEKSLMRKNQVEQPRTGSGPTSIVLRLDFSVTHYFPMKWDMIIITI
jgi:hypothetical protein